MDVTQFCSALLAILYTVPEEVSALYGRAFCLSTNLVTHGDITLHGELSRNGGVDRFRHLNPAGASSLKGRGVRDHAVDSVYTSAAFLREHAAAAQVVEAWQEVVVYDYASILSLNVMHVCC
ncbi:hypothetical protein AKJ16_DCAP17331 [Drosera capensis]